MADCNLKPPWLKSGCVRSGNLPTKIEKASGKRSADDGAEICCRDEKAVSKPDKKALFA
jgi:hypothetical protein